MYAFAYSQTSNTCSYICRQTFMPNYNYCSFLCHDPLSCLLSVFSTYPCRAGIPTTKAFLQSLVSNHFIKISNTEKKKIMLDGHTRKLPFYIEVLLFHNVFERITSLLHSRNINKKDIVVQILAYICFNIVYTTPINMFL